MVSAANPIKSERFAKRATFPVYSKTQTQLRRMIEMSPVRRLIRPWFITTALCLVYVGIVILSNKGNPNTLVTLGTRFSQQVADGTEGYDGQFNYYIAHDPN